MAGLLLVLFFLPINAQSQTTELAESLRWEVCKNQNREFNDLEAVKACEAILEQNELSDMLAANLNEDEVHFALGFALERLGYLPEAIQSYNNALLINPRYFNAYFRRGVVGIREESFSTAVKDLDEAIRLNPSSSHYFLHRARAFSKIKDYPSALSDLDEAVRLDPFFIRGFVTRGRIKLRVNDIEGGISDLKRGIELGFDHLPTIDRLAWHLATADDGVRNGDLAVIYAERVTAEDRSLRFLNSLSAAYAASSRFEDAILVQKEIREIAVSEGYNDLSIIDAAISLYSERKPLVCSRSSIC